VNEFDEISVARNNETVVVEKRCCPRVVKRDRSSFIVIWKEIHK
jgi:hypothetical protein